MPQLEQIHTFLGQIFWLVVTFGFLYVVLWKAALPRVASILLERQERIDESRIDKARDEAIGNIQTVAVEVAQAATARLIGKDVSTGDAEAAVASTLQERN